MEEASDCLLFLLPTKKPKQYIRATGSAFVVSDATLIRDSNDPFADGIGQIAGRLAN